MKMKRPKKRIIKDMGGGADSSWDCLHFYSCYFVRLPHIRLPQLSIFAFKGKH